MDKKQKQAKEKELRERLDHYEKILAREMKGYRGVIHESAVSEIKHTKVMVYRAMVDSLRVEIKTLDNS